MSRARAQRRAAAIAAAAADIVAWANNLDMESGVPVGEGAHASGAPSHTSTDSMVSRGLQFQCAQQSRWSLCLGMVANDREEFAWVSRGEQQGSDALKGGQENSIMWTAPLLGKRLLHSNSLHKNCESCCGSKQLQLVKNWYRRSDLNRHAFKGRGF